MVAKKQKRSRKYRVANLKPHVPAISLLDLPPELRNTIYKFALTEPDGITVCRHPGVSRSRKKPIMAACGDQAYPVNQIKLVNRQLHQETAGLKIRYSTVIFQSESHSRAGAINQFLAFIRHCAPSKLLWLTHVILKENIDWTVDTPLRGCPMTWLKTHMRSIKKAMKACAANPHMCVHLELPGWAIINDAGDYTAMNFISVAIALARMFRGEDIAHITGEFGDATQAAYAAMCDDALGKHKAAIEEIGGRARNLKFMPRHCEWDVGSFCSEAAETWAKIATVPFPGEERVTMWIKCAREWIVDGF